VTIPAVAVAPPAPAPEAVAPAAAPPAEAPPAPEAAAEPPAPAPGAAHSRHHHAAPAHAPAAEPAHPAEAPAASATHAAAAAAVVTPPPEPAPPVRGAREVLGEAEKLLGQGEVGEACARGEEAKRMSAKLPAVYKFLGKCYMRAGRASQANDAYRKYLEIAPTASDAPFIKSMIK
jgi:hypothetical protein